MRKRLKIIISLLGMLLAAGILIGLRLADSGPAAQTVNAAPAAASDSVRSAARSVRAKKRKPARPDASNPKQKIAYLTFDDGPSGMTPKLLAALKGCRVRATFFVVGLQAEKYPGALRQIVRGGNVVGVHSWTHKYSYIYKNMQNFSADFNELKDYIKKETGIAPNVCRFPGGTNNTVYRHYSSGPIMRQAVSLTHHLGFAYYDWNVSSGEASSVPPSKAAIVRTVVSQCENKRTAVILFHDTENQGYVDAVPEIVAKLRSMGFAFDTLSPQNPPKFRAKGVRFKAR